MLELQKIVYGLLTVICYLLFVTLWVEWCCPVRTLSWILLLSFQDV